MTSEKPENRKGKDRKVIKGQPAATLFPSNSQGISPFSPNHLIDIFIDPQRFFSTEAALGRPFSLFITALLLGLSTVLYVILGDTLLVITETIDAPRIPPDLINSWVELWMGLLVTGVVTSAFLWFVAGWWFRERALLSGARRPDFQLSRIVYVYSSLVRSLPLLLMLLVWTFRYPNYAAVPSQEIFIASALSVVFSCGELVTAYVGVRTLFDVDKWRAGIWFVMGPAVWYAVALSL